MRVYLFLYSYLKRKPNTIIIISDIRCPSDVNHYCWQLLLVMQNDRGSAKKQTYSLLSK